MHCIDFPTLAEIRELIAQRPRSVSLADIANAAQASVGWVDKLIAEDIEEPSYSKITAVYKYLKEQNK